MVILLIICLVIVTVACWLVMLFIVEFDNTIGCMIFGHKWSLYTGHEQLRVHQKAECLRCGKRPHKQINERRS